MQELNLKSLVKCLTLLKGKEIFDEIKPMYPAQIKYIITLSKEQKTLHFLG